MDDILTQFTIKKFSDSYWRITFNNPPINLVNPETILEFQKIINMIEMDKVLQVVVFDSTNPDYFFARYDLTRVKETPTQTGPTGLPTWIDFTTRLSQVPVISIASIRGRTRGVGSEFALACDLRFGSREKAILGQPEVPAGVIPGGGAIERLPLLVGRARALEIIVGGDDFDAETAERYGWLNRSIADSKLDEFVDSLAKRIANFDKTAVIEAKRLVNRNSQPSAQDMIESQTVFLKLATSSGAVDRGIKARAVAKQIGLEEFELRLGHYLGRL